MTNIQRVLQTIKANPKRTATELSQITGLTKPSVLACIKVLVDDHLVEGKHWNAQYTYSVVPEQHWAHRKPWGTTQPGYIPLTGNLAH